MTTCPACGSEVEREAVKCGSCGIQLAGTAQMGAVNGSDDGALPDQIGPTALPSLVVVKGPDTGERFVLQGAEVTIGRDPASDIFFNDVTVSREHAVVVLDDDAVTVADRGSLNGTYVNGAIVDQARLADGDHVQIGRFLLVFFAGEKGGA
jgi:pSer/pThr/pTyr-binding forkhead associated (FHA) protein